MVSRWGVALWGCWALTLFSLVWNPTQYYYTCFYFKMIFNLELFFPNLKGRSLHLQYLDCFFSFSFSISNSPFSSLAFAFFLLSSNSISFFQIISHKVWNRFQCVWRFIYAWEYDTWDTYKLELNFILSEKHSIFIMSIFNDIYELLYKCIYMTDHVVCKENM